MMKKIIFFLLMFFLSTIAIYAQDDKEIKRGKVGSGMELIRIGAARILVPKGTRYRRNGNVIIFEDLGGYTGRRFLEMEERLSRIETRQGELKKEIEEIKKLLKESPHLPK